MVFSRGAARRCIARARSSLFSHPLRSPSTITDCSIVHTPLRHTVTRERFPPIVKTRNVDPERREADTERKGWRKNTGVQPPPPLSVLTWSGERKGIAEGRVGDEALAEVNAPSSRTRRIRLLTDDARGTRTTLSKARRDARANARELRDQIPRRIGVWGGRS